VTGKAFSSERVKEISALGPETTSTGSSGGRVAVAVGAGVSVGGGGGGWVGGMGEGGACVGNAGAAVCTTGWQATSRKMMITANERVFEREHMASTSENLMYV
jgi:hypothetical protein